MFSNPYEHPSVKGKRCPKCKQCVLWFVEIHPKTSLISIIQSAFCNISYTTPTAAPASVGVAAASPAPVPLTSPPFVNGPHICSVCGRDFATPAALYGHGRTHSKATTAPANVGVAAASPPFVNGPHICSVCGRGFATPAALYGHRRIHSKT